jgi:ABC-2 type transport system permease protein
VTHFLPFVILGLALAFSVWRRRTRAGSGTQRKTRGIDIGSGHLGIVGLVAGREVQQRIRGRAFRIATALILVGVAAAIVIPTLIHSKAKPVHMGVVGSLSAAERTAVLNAARSAGSSVEFVDEPNQDAAETALRHGGIKVAILNGANMLVYKADEANSTIVRVVASALGTARAVQAAQLTPAQVNALAGAEALPVHSLRTAKAKTPETATAVISLIVMFVLLSQYLTWTLMGVMEEKSNRVVEVLLATLRPLQLLAGKLLGIGAVVFVQAALVVGVALGLAKAVGSDVLKGASPLTLLAFLLWLVLGYAFYSWLYAAAGSTVERQDQVQTLAIPLALPMMVGYIGSISVVSSGSANAFLKVLAFLPPTAPFAMPTLVALHAVSWWQFIFSVAIVLATTAVTARLAATVYRRAILRTGGRVRLRDVFRQVEAPAGPGVS